MMNILENLPVLIIILPTSAALLNPAISRISKRLGQIVIIISLAFAFICAAFLSARVINSGEALHYCFGNWEAPLGIEFLVDPLGAVLAMFITFIAMCTAIYCMNYFSDRQWLVSAGFYTLVAMLCVGLCGMVLTNDFFNLYVFLEISSLSSYGLVALGGDKAVMAAFRYLLIGTIGASFYLIGVGMLYSMTGSLNMSDVSEIIQSRMDDPLIIISCMCFVCAFGIKMAMFPFHVWQPDAHSSAHPGGSVMISGAMIKAPAFGFIRFFYFVFGINHQAISDTLFLLLVFGCIGMIFGSYMALGQTNFKRMLAYSSIAQMGYVALGIGLGNLYGVTGAYLHILTHVFMKGGLFFAAGMIYYRFGTVNINDFGQLHKKMPITCAVIVVCGLSMIGIPPTGGFFSKWYLMLGAAEKGFYPVIAVLVISSLMNAFYFLRVMEKIFISPEVSLEEKRTHPKALELPLSMVAPAAVFAILVVAIGFASSWIVQYVAIPAFEGVL